VSGEKANIFKAQSLSGRRGRICGGHKREGGCVIPGEVSSAAAHGYSRREEGAGEVSRGRSRRMARREGTPQGGPLSPLLSNILLDELDLELEKRGHAFCRYADDSAPRRADVKFSNENHGGSNCTRDEGRPLGLGLQGQGPNHRKLLWPNGRGSERSGKGGVNPSGECREGERK
jgi:hypothetical protein